MTDRMNNPQHPQSQDDVVQVSQREVERYIRERQPIGSKLRSEAAYPLRETMIHDQKSSNNENSPDSSIQFLGQKKRPGGEIEKGIQNPLRKILHRRDTCNELSVQFTPQNNEKLSDVSRSLNQSFFANLLDKNTTFHSKINPDAQNKGQIESKVRNIEDLFEDVFLMEIQRNPLCTLMQQGKKERDRSYSQSQQEQAPMGIRLNNENLQHPLLVGQNFSPNYPQNENNTFKYPIQQSNSLPKRTLRSNTKEAKKQIKYQKRIKNISIANQTEEIQEIYSDNEAQVTNLKSLEITTNMVRKQNQSSMSKDVSQQNSGPIQNSKTKKIKPNELSWILSNQDQQFFQEFLEVIRITKDRNMPNGEKDYRWKLGTISIWRNINTALQINFATFIRQSKKYQNIFKRYIPHQLHFKIELDQNKKKQETVNTLQIPQAKLQSRKDRKKKQQIKNLVKIRQLFNKAQLAKIIDYEKMIDEKGRSEALLDLAQSQCSDYEPEQALLENMIEDIVQKTNIKQRKGSKIEANDTNKRQLQAKNELVIYNLTKASKDYNYIRNMARIFNFYRRVPTLSCLGGGSLGLRSNNCKIIDQSTFLLELKQIQIQETTTLIPENNSLDQIKYERNSTLFTAN